MTASEKDDKNGNGSEKQASADQTAALPRWTRANRVVSTLRGRKIAAACCLFAALVGAFVGFASLPTCKNNTVFVSLFVEPEDDELLGIDAPYYPLVNCLFGWIPSNIEANVDVRSIESTAPKTPVSIETPDTESPSAATPNASPTTAKPSKPKSYRLTDWRDAVLKCDHRDDLVLHVSAVACIQQDQVVFPGSYGFGEPASSADNTTFNLQQVLATIAECKAKRTLLVLEVHWPLKSDGGESNTRLHKLNHAIRREFEQSDNDKCQLLLSSDGNGHARGMAPTRQSQMTYSLNNAAQNFESDTNRDGQLSIEEIVRAARPQIERASVKEAPSPSIELVGNCIGFMVSMNAKAQTEVAAESPDAFAKSWKLREQYLAASKLPFLPDTAKRWEDKLKALESRWHRGGQAIDIEADILAIESQCLAEIERSLALRRAARCDSLAIAADRFPLDTTNEANRNVETLLSKYNEILSTVPVEGKDALFDKAIAEYVATFKPDDAAVAIGALMHAIERSTTIDAPLLDLLNRVSTKASKKLKFPTIDAINQLANVPVDSHRAGNLLRLYHAQDRLGANLEASPFLTSMMRRAFERLVNAQKLAWTFGMTSDTVIDQELEMAVNTAEATLAAERKVGLAIRQLKAVANEFATSNLVAANEADSGSFDEVVQSVESIVNVLEQMQQRSNNSHNIEAPSAIEIASLHQATESLGRCSTSLPTIMRVDSRSGQRLSQALNRLDTMTSASNRTQRTLWETFIANACEVDAISSYRKIAERHAIVIGDDMPSLATTGTLDPLTWDSPNTTLSIQLENHEKSDRSIKFEFLEPASSSLRIEPNSGSLQNDQTLPVRLSLISSQPPQENGLFHGVWLRLTEGGHERLIPFPMPTQPFEPKIDIDFGAWASSEGRNVRMLLWPSTKPQTIDWFIRSNDSNVKSVLVTISSSNSVSLTSAAIPLDKNLPSQIRFAPLKPVAKGEPTPPSLAGVLKVTVNDATSGIHLGAWTIKTELRDPRGMVELGWAQYRVDEKGKNRLDVSVGNVPNSNALFRAASEAPTVRLDLAPTKMNSLIDFGDSRLQSSLRTDGSRLRLYAESLRFVEGSAPQVTIPLLFNGDPGYFELEGRFPREAGIVELQWNRRPELSVEGPVATTPGLNLATTIAARNLDDQQALLVECVSAAENDGEVLWQTILPSSREIDCSFSAGENDASLSVVAVRRDWSISVPSSFGTGPHRLRVSTVSPVGNRPVIAEHRFVVDDGVPSEIYARADSEPERTTIHVTFKESASGVKDLTLTPSSSSASEKPVSIAAIPVKDSEIRWSAVWPQGMAIPEQIQISFTTGAGKKYTKTVDLLTRKIAANGTVAGRVMEGSIPQPNVTVVLTQVDGSAVKSYQTSEDGEFSFTVSPGTYLVNAKKPSTTRKANVRVVVQVHETTITELNLQRPSLLIE